MEKWDLTWTSLEKLSKEIINALPDNTPGVYRLSFKHMDGNYYVFYVGQSSTSIKERLLAHISTNEANVCILNHISKSDCYFRYAMITNEDVRNSTVRQAFDFYQPSCNENRPMGRDDININLN